jgi:hypothetical protein
MTRSRRSTVCLSVSRHQPKIVIPRRISFDQQWNTVIPQPQDAFLRSLRLRDLLYFLLSFPSLLPYFFAGSGIT